MLPQLVPQQDTNLEPILEPISALNGNFYIAKLVQRAVPKSVLTRHSLLPVLGANFSSLRATGGRVLQKQRSARNTGGLNLD